MALHHVTTQLDQAPESEQIDDLGAHLRRLFVVWNRSYKRLCIVAEDVSEALLIAESVKHLRRAQQYRRFADVTEKALAGETFEVIGDFGPTHELAHVLNAGHSGVLSHSPEGYAIAGHLVKKPHKPIS
ncbi:hypothetical protein [Sphingomonas sp. NFR04]|uniref:hypothetical protein n=1 Tax=Sphingomonas sp. NFR04 TaxID=1566283 RepID=UPI000B825CE9|nr:hypothetical protein [Sphingomonas sp. NFR04]